jgi:hypothetical protein
VLLNGVWFQKRMNKNFLEVNAGFFHKKLKEQVLLGDGWFQKLNEQVLYVNSGLDEIPCLLFQKS